MDLIGYLDKIDNEEPINFDAFRKKLPDGIRSGAHSYFDAFPVTRVLCTVAPKDPDIMGELRAGAVKPENRIHASVLGNSHSHGTSCAYLLVFHEAVPHTYPEVVTITEDGGTHCFQPKTQALLIENEENFSAFKTMLSLVSKWYGREVSLANTDVILAAGNRINKKVTLSWLNDTYDHILCAFDYDLGGLKMFTSLNASVRGAAFVCPPDFSDHSELFVKSPENSDRLIEAIDLAMRHKLPQLSEAFASSRRFMEQESLLYGVENN
jgi:hypothetical protein